MAHCLSVDLGTTQVKAGVYDSEGVCEASAQVGAKIDTSAGHCVQYADDFLVSLKAALGQMDFDLSKVDVVSFTGQMAGTVGVDRNFEPVTIWSGTMDIRSTVVPVPDKDILLATGGSISPIMVQKILMFNEPRAFKYMGLASYVAGRITGISAEDAFIQETNLTWTGLADIKGKTWSGDLIKMFGVEKDLLPRIADTLEVVGGVSPEAARELGLKQGVPVMAGIGDKIAGCMGLGAYEQWDVVDEHASVPAITVCTNEFKTDSLHGTWEIHRGVREGQYYLIVYTPGTGIALEWFIENFAQEQKRQIMETGGNVHDILEGLAAKTPAGSAGLICVSLLGGRALPYEPDIRGVFLGHDLSHTIGHFYRAFLESFAYENNRCMDGLADLYPGLKIQNIKSIGGGSGSALLNQLKSDVMQYPYFQMDRGDLSLLGCANIGFMGIGIYDGFQDGVYAGVQREYTPDTQNKETYAKLSGIYKKLLQANAPVFKELAEVRKQTG